MKNTTERIVCDMFFISLVLIRILLLWTIIFSVLYALDKPTWNLLSRLFDLKLFGPDVFAWPPKLCPSFLAVAGIASLGSVLCFLNTSCVHIFIYNHLSSVEQMCSLFLQLLVAVKLKRLYQCETEAGLCWVCWWQST